MPEAGQRCRVAPTPPILLGLLGSGWVSQQSLSEIFLLPGKRKKKKKKNPKHKNTRKPKSDLVQALEHLWHWTLRKSFCVSGRNLRSGHQGPGSAGPRSCLLGWAPARAAGGQSCVSGHPVGSADRKRGQVMDHPGAHCFPALCPYPYPYLQQVAVAIGPGAKAQKPFSRAQWGGTDRLGEMKER